MEVCPVSCWRLVVVAALMSRGDLCIFCVECALSNPYEKQLENDRLKFCMYQCSKCMTKTAMKCFLSDAL